VPTSHWLKAKGARVNSSQSASGMILQNHRRLPASIFSVKIAALGYLKRVTKGFSELVSTGISEEQAKTLSLIFSTTNKQKIVKTVSACTESTFIIISLNKKFISLHNPFKIKLFNMLTACCVPDGITIRMLWKSIYPVLGKDPSSQLQFSYVFKALYLRLHAFT
jgi:hypothetical protein